MRGDGWCYPLGNNARGVLGRQSRRVWSIYPPTRLDDSFATGNRFPSDVTEEFPGPIAATLYGDDADVVGVQSPVGSGKTTTLMNSRGRRAVMMPRNMEEGSPLN